MFLNSKLCKFIFTVIILSSCNANDNDTLYDADSGVTELTEENFKKLVIDDLQGLVWIVVFYAPWCAHSQALVPEFTTAAKVLRSVVEFGAVNGEKYKNLSHFYNVPGFPYIKIFGRVKENPENYLGPRRAKEIIRAGWAAELNNWFEES